jgi:16S rRNA processing protein RimM
MSRAAERPEVVVGRVGRAHGVRGEVAVDVRTDTPEERFAVGARMDVTPPRGTQRPVECPGTLEVERTRWHQSRLLVTFAGLADRTRAELLRGMLLTVTLDPEDTPEDPEEFYDHQLEGLEVRTPDGEVAGTVAEVIHGAAQDLLAVRTVAGEVLVPFVQALVPTVDVTGGFLVVADRPGLLDPEAGES